jgi:hypothetical protein
MDRDSENCPVVRGQTFDGKMADATSPNIVRAGRITTGVTS